MGVVDMAEGVAVEGEAGDSTVDTLAVGIEGDSPEDSGEGILGAHIVELL